MIISGDGAGFPTEGHLYLSVVMALPCEVLVYETSLSFSDALAYVLDTRGIGLLSNPELFASDISSLCDLDRDDAAAAFVRSCDPVMLESFMRATEDQSPSEMARAESSARTLMVSEYRVSAATASTVVQTLRTAIERKAGLSVYDNTEEATDKSAALSKPDRLLRQLKPGNAIDAKTKIVLALALVLAALCGGGVTALLMRLGGDETRINASSDELAMRDTEAQDDVPVEVTVDLSDLMSEISYEGFDGYASVTETISIDRDKKEALLRTIDDADKRDLVRNLLDSVTYDTESNGMLGNGDQLTVHASYDKSAAIPSEVILTGETNIIEVIGLESLPSYLENASYYDGRFYKLVDEPMSWTEARRTCGEQNGHLATVSSKEEQDFINSLIEEQGTLYHYWLGATDEDTEGDWKWVTGESVPMPGDSWGYENWCGNQPNNKTDYDEAGQDYMEIQKTRGDQGEEEYLTWTDISDSGFGGERFFGPPDYNEPRYYGYICEWD